MLFDIDRTLIRRAGPHHRQDLVEAVQLKNAGAAKRQERGRGTKLTRQLDG
jgi:hypothetical protein